MTKQSIIKELLEKNAKLEEELLATKEHLKKYTAPASRKEYYEKNKETRKKLSEARKDKKLSRETIDKLVMPRKKQRNDKIIQYDIRGNRLNSFDTCKEAADYIGIVYTNIYMCLT